MAMAMIMTNKQSKKKRKKEMLCFKMTSSFTIIPNKIPFFHRFKPFLFRLKRFRDFAEPFFANFVFGVHSGASVCDAGGGNERQKCAFEKCTIFVLRMRVLEKLFDEKNICWCFYDMKKRRRVNKSKIRSFEKSIEQELTNKRRKQVEKNEPRHELSCFYKN